MTHEKMQETIEVLESKLLDAQVECNIRGNRIADLERQLHEANSKIRELEVGTQALRTLSIESEEEESFDPRESGVFRYRDNWSNAR